MNLHKLDEEKISKVTGTLKNAITHSARNYEETMLKLGRTTPIFCDRVGVEVKVGDFVIYAHSVGRVSRFRYAKVAGVQWGKLRFNKDDAEWQPKLKVTPVNDDFEYREPFLCIRDGVLELQDKVLKINKDQVPRDILKLLDGVKL